MNLECPAFPGQLEAMNELIALALQVAKRLRGEDRLQPRKTIILKLLLEYAELEEALCEKSLLDVTSELADVTYYTTCLFALDGNEHDLQAVLRDVCLKAGATAEQAYTAALTKYRLRTKQPKDISAENEAIRFALHL